MCVSIGIILHGTYSDEAKGKQISACKTRVKPILAQHVHVLYIYHYCDFVANVHPYNGEEIDVLQHGYIVLKIFIRIKTYHIIHMINIVHYCRLGVI